MKSASLFTKWTSKQERDNMIYLSLHRIYHISIKSLKVELFKDLIGKIEKIIYSDTVGSASSVTNDVYTEWNELLCKIIILASFTKINQA